MTFTMNASANNIVVFDGEVVDGDTVVTNLPQQSGSDANWLILVVIQGNNVDIRKLGLLCLNQLPATDGNFVEISEVNTDTNPNYTFNSITLNSSGQLVISSTNSEVINSIQYGVSFTPLGPKVFAPTIP